jgi:hypothetical protein
MDISLFPPRSSKGIVISVQEKLPPVREKVIVVCKNFQCLGYLDEKAIWRNAAKSSALADVIGWMELSNWKDG